MIPDILEAKFAQMKADVSKRVDRVGEELKDVTKAIKEVGNQIGDVPSAMKGQNRSGKKSKRK